MNVRHRPYCVCRRVRNYSYDQAAKKLGCYRSWLENNISRLPHQKYGISPVFCDCELLLIQEMYTVVPAGVLEHLAALEAQTEAAPATVLTLEGIRPAGATRTRTA